MKLCKNHECGFQEEEGECSISSRIAKDRK